MGVLDVGTRRVVRIFFTAAALLVPWAVWLAVALPMTTSVRRWAVAWAGLDVVEATALVVTGWLLLRRHALLPVAAGITAGLLVVDGWFDVTTATKGWDLGLALALALLVELPLAALCLRVGYRATAQQRGSG